MHMQRKHCRVTRGRCWVYFYLDLSFSQFRPQVYFGFHSLIFLLPPVQFPFRVLWLPPICFFTSSQSVDRLFVLHTPVSFTSCRTNWPTDKQHNLVTEFKIWHTSFLFPYVWLFQKIDNYWVYFNFTQILCWMDATEIWYTNQIVV